MFLANSIHYSNSVYNYFKDLNLGLFLSDVYIHHLASITTAVFQTGCHRKIIDFAKNSDCHRTTIAHFLNHGKWDDHKLQKLIKQMVIDIILLMSADGRLKYFSVRVNENLHWIIPSPNP